MNLLYGNINFLVIENINYFSQYHYWDGPRAVTVRPKEKDINLYRILIVIFRPEVEIIL